MDEGVWITKKKSTHLTEDVNVMSEQWLQREQAKAPGWLQRDVEDKRRMEKRQRMEEWRKEKRQRLEERRLRRRLRRMWDGESDLEPLIKYMGADSMDVESIEPGVVNEDTEELSLEQDREPLLTEDVMDGLASIESGVVNEDTEQLQMLIGGMHAIESGVVNEDTEVLSSLEREAREQEREARQELGSFTPAPGAREQLLKGNVMNGLPSIESGVVNEDTEQLQMLIGGMHAIESGVVNEGTEVLSSLERQQNPAGGMLLWRQEQEQGERQEFESFTPAPAAQLVGRERRKVHYLEWIFVIANFVLELPSAVFDQLSSVHKPQFALSSMLMSFAALFICIAELVYKCRKEKVTWKWKGILPWLYSLRSHKPFGSFKDIIGLVCAICQSVVTTINCIFCLQHADNPIKISLWPIIFAFGLLCSKFLGNREHVSTNLLPLNKDDTHDR